MALDSYKPNDLVRIEDDLQEILEHVRRTRQGMVADGIESLTLNFGTFIFYVAELKPMAIKLEAAYKEEKARAHSKMTRAKRKKT